MTRRAVPTWLPGRTWYHVHALRATGAPDDQPTDTDTASGHALRGIVEHLDHVVELGCTGLLLTPIAASRTHGYDTIDARRVDPRLGDDDDFDALVTACRQRDIRLVLDGVPNHVGRTFAPFLEVLAHGPRSAPARDWFRIDPDGDGPDGFAYRDFEGHRELVALNHDSPVVLEWAADIALHWLGRGADGWRFDVAYAIPPDFLAEVSRRVRSSFPDAFLFGEMIHGDYAAFVDASGLDGVTQYELHKALWSSCNDRNLFELAWALQRHAEMARAFVPVTFGGNHDVTRLASKLVERTHIEIVLAVLFTVPGTPCVYYGDEWAATGEKVEGPGGDDAVRPRFDELIVDHDIERRHRQWIAFRRQRPWLTTATLEVGTITNERLTYVVADAASDRTVEVTLDLASDQAHVDERGG